MKYVKTKKAFIDSKGKETRILNEVFRVDEARAEELKNKGLVDIVETKAKKREK